MAMALDVYNNMLNLAKVRGGATRPVVPWPQIEGTVERFVSKHAETWMKNFTIAGVVVKQVSTAAFEGYDEKIKILNKSYNLNPIYRDVYGDQAFRLRQQRQSKAPRTGSGYNFNNIPLGI